ncbi:LppP/LprE family lipoprotein [Mycolicibacter longobardus]|uniref:LppP/LprE family lipoprotein n=1 Tax=Mycolicibacter longobardus TaxID=1108812 RepID=UPI0027E21C28|nr:LppP/LprE family lipoprotein [Mycolicibacter longobardus]MCV7382222.1 LppP/LprE family lipoprotein [Mycolicibacter longobardus]
MTTPSPIPGWYPDPSGKNLRYWDGTTWTSAVQPAPVSRLFGLPVRRWAQITVVVVAVLLANGVIRWWLHHSEEQQRWSLWPHTMGCAVTPRPDFPAPLPPASVRAEQVTVERIEGAHVVVSVTFAAPPPGPPRQFRLPGGGMMAAPGSLEVYFFFTAPHLGSPTANDMERKGILIEAPLGGSGERWKAWQSDLSPSGQDREVPVSVTAAGRVMRIELDLTGQDRLFGDGPFTPTMLVDSLMNTRPTRDPSDGVPKFFQDQLCLWDTATTPARPVESTVPQSAPPAAPPSSAPGAPCGPDQATAVRHALSQLGPEPTTTAAWDTTPLESNYDPCADLSTVLIAVVGGTGSSPMQALMFHRGGFLGTGTSKAYPFTSLDAGASTPDTIVLRYRSGQSCTACNDGTVTTVRYHWDGNSVQMLDPPPP